MSSREGFVAKHALSPAAGPPALAVDNGLDDAATPGAIDDSDDDDDVRALFHAREGPLSRASSANSVWQHTTTVRILGQRRAYGSPREFVPKTFVRGEPNEFAIEPWPPEGIALAAPEWWAMPVEVSGAAARFDASNVDRTERAIKMVNVIEAKLHDGRRYTSAAKMFEQALNAVRSTRFIAPMIVKEEAESGPRKRYAAADSDSDEGSYEESDEEPVQKCDAKDVVDTPDVEKRRISNDWWRACGMGADTLVTKVDANGGNDSTGDGIADELQEIESLLWDLRGFVFILFQYYTCIGSDLCFMGLNQWSQFVDECNVADNKSKFLKKSDLDRLFIAIDTKAAMSQQKKQAGSPSAQNKHHDDLKKKVLHRVEFLVGLVHIAILRYVATGEIVKVVDALRTLLVDDIRPMLNPKVLKPTPNTFRKAACYRPEVDKTLRIFESSLRSIFTAMCLSGGLGEKGKHLSLEEWKMMLRACDIITADCSERDAAMCFAWSRMCVVDELKSDHARMRDSHLPFEGFLEALVRLSLLKALPTDAEIEDSGFADAGEYLRELRTNNEDAFQALLVTRNPQWGDDPTQPVHRSLAHVCSILVRHVEELNGGGAANGAAGIAFQVSQPEANKWAKKFMSN